MTGKKNLSYICVMKEKNRRCVTNVITLKGIIPLIIGKILTIASKTDADHNNLCILHFPKTPNAFYWTMRYFMLL